MNLHGSFLRKTLTDKVAQSLNACVGLFGTCPVGIHKRNILSRMFSRSPFRPMPGLVQQRQLLPSVSGNLLSPSNPTIKLYVN